MSGYESCAMDIWSSMIMASGGRWEIATVSLLPVIVEKNVMIREGTIRSWLARDRDFVIEEQLQFH